MDTRKFANRIIELIFTKKGFDVKLIDLNGVTIIADYFIICSADSEIQVRAIADEIDKVLRKDGIKCYHKEGMEALHWVLLDYFDVVVHIFKKETREYYNIEKLWGDATISEITDPALPTEWNTEK